MSEFPRPTEPRPVPPPAPTRKKSPVALYAALAVVGAGAILGIMRSQPPAEGPAATSTPAAARTRATALGPDSPGGPSNAQLVIFVPGLDGGLKKRSVPLDPSSVRSAKGEPADVLATLSVNALIKASPETFPPGARLTQSVKSEQGAPSLSFNRAFVDESFWQGSARTLGALDSIAMTVGEARRQALGEAAGSGGVRFLAEGKPIAALGEIDLREPYQPSAKAPAESAP